MGSLSLRSLDLTLLAEDDHKTCEFCKKDARFVCRKCFAAFYCSTAHRFRNAMHSYTCVKRKIVRTSPKTSLTTSKTNSLSIVGSRDGRVGGELSRPEDIQRGLSEVMTTQVPTETPPVLLNQVKMFKDINPFMDYSTLFQREYAVQVKDSTLVEEDLSMDSIVYEVTGASIDYSEKKIMLEKFASNPCIKINKQASAKNLNRACEMCPESASLCCRKCSATFYCGWPHYYLDSHHSKVCDKMKLIRWPTVFKNPNLERRRQTSQKLLLMESLLDDLIYAVYLSLAKRQYQKAQGILFQCLKYVRPVFGENGEFAQMVTLHCAMAESFLGMDNMGAVTKFIDKALAVFHTESDIGNVNNNCKKMCRAQVNRIQGLYALHIGVYDDAKYHFSEYIYLLTGLLRPTHVRLCFGYYLLGKTFIKAGDSSNGDAMLAFCFDMWLEYLTDSWRDVLGEAPYFSNPRCSYQTAYVNQEDGSSAPLTSVIILEAALLLIDVWDLISHETHPVIALKVYLCQGILAFLQRNYQDMKQYAEMCLELIEAESMRDATLISISKYMLKISARRLVLLIR